MDLITQHQRTLTRRQLFNHACNGVGAAALAALLGTTATASEPREQTTVGGIPDLPHFPPRGNAPAGRGRT